LIVGLAARDEIMKRAEAIHLGEDGRVTGQINDLSSDFRLRYWAGLIQDTVGRSGWPDTMLQRAYLNNKEYYTEPPMVNVAEVLVRTEAEAREVAKAARAGADFARLARTRSIRLWAAKRGGELGFNTKAGFGVEGEKFFAARKGEIIGPDRVDPYWGVFKILGQQPSRTRSFVESRDRVLAQVKERKKKEVFLAALGELRKKASVTMNVETLANIQVHLDNK
jgi:hypothetical protein